MKKFLLAVLISVLGAVSAHADTFTFTDNNPADVYLNPLNKSYTGTFDLTGYGYNPATMQVDSAVTDFTFGDLFGSESFTIKWDGDSYSHGSFSGFLFVSPTLSITAIADLSADGILSYTVSSTTKTGEFWLLNARLTAQASTVPDGGATAALLGMGLIGLTLAARRRR